MSCSLLTPNEAAARVRVRTRTLQNHIAAGTGPAVIQIGRKVLIAEDALEEWITRHEVKPGAAAEQET